MEEQMFQSPSSLVEASKTEMKWKNDEDDDDRIVSELDKTPIADVPELKEYNVCAPLSSDCMRRWSHVRANLLCYSQRQKLMCLR